MKTLLTLIIGAFAMISLMASAQGNNLMLHHANLEDLSPEAQEHYTKAVEAMDRIDTITAVNEMAAAAEIATQEVEIQLLFIDLAKDRLRADSFGLDEAVAMAERTTSAYERLLARENLPEWAHLMLQSEYDSLVDILENLDERLATRYEIGSQFIEQQQAMIKRVEEAQAVWRSQEAVENRANRRLNDGQNIDGHPLLPSGNL